ncbi:hypothetical protein SS50377_28331 [Spironucleus salmonicida]|uniref:Uncharacterized protein n=1 Tax=Spironucleus salmonicida TaxID=348837 RepID=V6LRR2_9EUKA|nr:hypothetical protein SS50377_28312 [Spironucleus salmonicida]KAH0570353.1 hypothetical protein SS50377_28331 [Spironucleus salmonicida]|eukprot:EST45543.1 Hypothetical protein SS50377_14509 [Spironucleus salmonicida]
MRVQRRSFGFWSGPRMSRKAPASTYAKPNSHFGRFLLDTYRTYDLDAVRDDSDSEVALAMAIPLERLHQHETIVRRLGPRGKVVPCSPFACIRWLDRVLE